MADLILDDARFQNLFGEIPTNRSVDDNRASAPGDGKLGATLGTDQSKLTYSFDFPCRLWRITLRGEPDGGHGVCR